MSKHSPQVNLQGFGINNKDQKFIIKELCRCCMGYIPKNLQICFNTTLSEVYFKVTAIQSDNNINFPNVVCPKCALQLEGMKSFIGKCEETDKKFKKLVEELEETLKIETVVKETTTNSNVETEVKEELKPVEEDISSELMVLRKVEENVDEDVWLPDNEDFDNDPNLQEPIEAKKKRLKASKSKTKPSEEGKYKNTCATCGIKFETLELLEKHYQDNNTCKPARFYCKICNKPEPHLSKLRRHEDTHKQHLKKSNLNCLTCGTWYRSYSLLTEHCKKKGCQLRVIKCKVCNKEFEKPSRLSRHMAVHNNEEWLPCTLCKKMFNCEDALKRHVKRHGDGNRTTCEICGKVLKSRISLSNHLSRVHPTEPLPTTPTHKCPQCPKLYTTPLKLKEHTLRVHKMKDLLCSYCGKAFNSKSFLTEHVRTHTGEKPFACELCPKSFRILSQRTVHMNTHTGNKPFGCDVCSMSFKVATHLIQHKRIHTGERPYECSFCEKKFALVGTWRVHERIHTGELPYPCSTCGKAFKSSSARTKHMQTHGIFYDREKTEKVEEHPSSEASAISTNKGSQYNNCIKSPQKIYLFGHSEPLPTTPTHKCPQCPKLYTTPLKLKEHTLRVHKKKDLLCSYCGKAFNSKSFLTEHVRTHTGEKPFACELCPKSFRILSQRTVHMNTHTGNKPFGCDVCSMSFKVATHLIQHKRIHTGERPYECSFCEKKFALVGTWRVHERIHTGELPYPCSTCGKAFKSSSARTKHMQTHGIFYDREKTEKVEAPISGDSATSTKNENQVSS